LLNVRNLSEKDAAKLMEDWLDKCHKLRKLDFEPRTKIYSIINPKNNFIYVTHLYPDLISVIKPTSISEFKMITDIIKGIIQNPLDVTNSIDSANEIRDILTDDNRDNDQIVCDLIDSEDEYTSNIREILNC
jgi:hypothetical protein